MEKQGLPEAETACKKPLPPLRHLDGLAQDYASDSGCFDDDDAPSLAAAMHEIGCSGLVHWDDPEGWDGEEPRGNPMHLWIPYF